MIHSNPVIRAARPLLLAGAALMVPLTASYAQGAPTPPTAPAAPQVREHRIVIIERAAADKGAEANLQTRVIDNDGKTIVIKTDKAMSEAEIEAKTALAMKAKRDLAPGAPSADGAERRVIVKRFSRDGAPLDAAAPHADHEKMAAACAKGGSSSLIESSETAADGKQQKVVMRFCSTGADLAKAGDGLKAARERISKDSNLSPAIRDDILKQLDAEIERLSKQG